MHQKKVCFAITGALKKLNLGLNHMFVINVLLYVSFQNQKELKY